MVVSILLNEIVDGTNRNKPIIYNSLTFHVDNVALSIHNLIEFALDQITRSFSIFDFCLLKTQLSS